MDTNKFGVPYHSYHLYFSNGDVVLFDMAWEEYWGNVNPNANMHRNGHFEDNDFIGYGNDEDGYYTIVKVHDDDNDCFITPKEFADRCVSYVDKYSC